MNCFSSVFELLDGRWILTNFGGFNASPKLRKPQLDRDDLLTMTLSVPSETNETMYNPSMTSPSSFYRTL